MALRINKIGFKRNPNIGLFGFANDKYCILGVEVSKETKKIIEHILQVPIYTIKIAGTSLAGVFIAGNNNGLVVPSIIYNEELDELKKIEDNILVLDTIDTAIANNITVNDNGVIASKDLEKEAVNELKKFFKLPINTTTINKINIVGSLITSNNTKGIISDEVEDDELKIIKDTLKVELLKTTLNFGSPYVHSAVIINNKGILVGESSTAIEINEVDAFYNFDD